MKRQPTSIDPSAPETLDALRRGFETYGADPAKWPAAMRDLYAAAGEMEELAAARADAEALDGFLDASTQPRMSADLHNRIMAQYAPPPARVSVLDEIAGVFSRFRLLPAGALAGVGALGLATGVLTASTQAALTPEYEAYAYLEDSSLAASLIDEEGAVLWDAD